MPRLRLGLLSVVSVLVGCEQAVAPPLFNAIDPTLQCPAGQVGWDFSTGGNFDQAVSDSVLSSEIRIVEATLGANCGLTPGNATDLFAGSCNGRTGCSRIAGEGLGYGAVDGPNPCRKDFRVRYTCGNEARVYEQYRVPSGDQNLFDRGSWQDMSIAEIRLECGDKLVIREATYGGNCPGPQKGNLTAIAVDKCNGARRCDMAPAPTLITNDPAYGCYKQVKITYGCVGNGSVDNIALFGENEAISFACPPRAPPPTPPTVNVMLARYGANCRNEKDILPSVRERCVNKADCSFTFKRSEFGIDDMSNPACKRELVVVYSCGANPGEVVSVVAEADGQYVPVRCGAALSVKSASFGANCNPELTNRAFDYYASRCEGLRSCVIGKGAPRVDSLYNPPTPNCVKQHSVKFNCDGTEYVETVDESDTKTFVCPAVPARAGFNAGIQLVEATYGADCADLEKNGRNNAYAQLQSCNGRDSCDVNFNGIGRDPAPKCANKPLLASYRCAEDPTIQTVKVDNAAGKNVKLSCAPPIKVLRGSYGASCGRPVGNGTSLVTDACGGKRMSCSFSVPPLEVETVLAPGASLTPFQKASAGSDANLEFYATSLQLNRRGIVPWSQTIPASTVLVMQNDGNLVSYNGSRGTWDTKTFGKPGSRLALRKADNALVIVDPNDNVLWRSGFTKVLEPGKSVAKGATLSQCGGTCGFMITSNGELTFLRRVASVLFKAGTAGTDANKVEMKADGNLVLSGPGGVRWQTNTGGNPGAYAAIDDAADRLVVVSAQGNVLWPNCSNEFTAEWMCGNDPAVKTVVIPGESANKSATLTCPDTNPTTVVKRCIPERCTGRERRTVDLKCAADSSLAVMNPVTEMKLVIRDDLDNTFDPTELKEDRPYSVVADFLHTNNCGACTVSDSNKKVSTVTVWAFDEFTNKNDSSDKVQGFRCVVMNGDLRPWRWPRFNEPFIELSARNYGYGTPLLHGGMLRQPLAPTCFGNRIGSWRDAAKRKGMVEAEFRQRYDISPQSKIRVSYDPEGKTVAFRSGQTSAENAFVPNPIGFYYDPAQLWVDTLKYYEQTAYGAPQTMTFTTSRDIRLAATKATIRSAELEVSLYDRFITPNLEVDVDWVMSGDAPGLNPLSPTGTPVTSAVKTLTQRNLGVTLEVTPVEVFNNFRQSATKWVAFDRHMVVGQPVVTKLGAGQANGQTVHVVAAFNDALKDRILKVGGNGWRRSFLEEVRSYRVRACIEVDGLQRTSSSNNDTGTLTATRGNLTYTAGFVPGKRCIVSDQLLTIRNDLEKRPFAKRAYPDESTGQATTKKQGDPDYMTSANDVGNQSRCARACTVDADCAVGNSCSTKDGRVGVCLGNDPQASCTSVDRNDMATSGAIGRSLFSSTTESDTTTTDTSTAGAGSDTEVLGYTVLDAGDDEEDESPVQTGWKKFEINLTPNIDAIIKVLKAESLAAQTAPIHPKFEKIRATEPDKGRMGIGVGIGREFYLMFTPVPIVVEVAATVGFALSLVVSFELNGDTYPCAGETSTCYKAEAMNRSFDDAMNNCASKGGRLAEMQKAMTYDAIKGAIGSSTDRYWLGGQAGYMYTNETCSRSEGSGNCRDASQTRWRWMATGDEFARGVGNGAVTTTASVINDGVSGPQNALTTSQPRESLVTFNASTSKLENALRSCSPGDNLPDCQNTKLKSVCEYRPAAKARTVIIGGGPNVEFSAGASLAVCVPSNLVGFCMQASIKVIAAEISAKLTWTNTKLYSMAGALLGTRANMNFKMEWALKFLTGAITAQLRLLLSDIEWDIIKYEGVQTSSSNADKYKGVLLNINWPTVKDLQ